jgi:hypothetical protein
VHSAAAAANPPSKPDGALEEGLSPEDANIPFRVAEIASLQSAVSRSSA